MSRKLTAAMAREMLNYDPETGVFTRRSSPRPGTIGRVLGAPDAKGYLRARIFDSTYLLHRVTWLYVYGVWPADQVDHKNHIRDDNRIANLRECTNAENRQNIRPEGYGVTGRLGVYKPEYGGWTAQIVVKQKMHYLGTFETPEAASAAYLDAKQKLHRFAATGVSELESLGV